MLNTIELRLAPLPRIARSFMQDLRAVLRLSCTIWHVARGLFIVTVLFPRLSDAQRQQHIGRWSRRVLRALGVTLRAQGHSGGACRGANPDRLVGEALAFTAHLGLRRRDFALSLVEERHLDLDGGADSPFLVALGGDARF